MAKRQKNRKKTRGFSVILSLFDKFSLPNETKRHIGGVFCFLLAIIFILSFFGKAGIAGRLIFKGLSFLIGKAVLVLPILLALSAFVFFLAEYKAILKPLILATILALSGFSGILESWKPDIKYGGMFGDIFNLFFLKLFGFWVTNIIFSGLIFIGGLIFWQLLRRSKTDESLTTRATEDKEKKPSLIRKIFTPSFKVKEVEPVSPTEKEQKEIAHTKIEEKEKKKADVIEKRKKYLLPPVDLLEPVRGQPFAGNVRTNSGIIKKTLENFDIPVEMSGINIGPTVTQYSLKPADGIKLSKITSLSSDLALALASHPIRIEAPIPGKSLVGIEVPNKKRVFVRLRELIKSPQFQESSSDLVFCLGKDVSGDYIYADLSRMPHLLVAGATGTGKTIFLNTLITSLLYRNSPDVLKFILIDPKRVEFTPYSSLPHLLCPAIVDSKQATNALKWLIDEMEKRFKTLAAEKARDIMGYNEQAVRNGIEIMPYIILIIDELADLMAAKGREVEGDIVRLAQMARAVGIHLVVATQRPSVEVITGLIKANITARITFQVASQVDSRTVLDMAGAEKLLGLGDMLFLSAEIIKPKRIQSAYISQKEVKKVVNWIKSKIENLLDNEISEAEKSLKERLAEGLEQALEVSASDLDEDPLYEEAKRTVIQYRRASASLLQRKLRIGYARAARLIDVLEEKGVVGPSQGARPREVYFQEKKESGDWEQV